MRYEPDASVTTVCSPCRAGEVAVTTTSGIGFLVDVSMTVPVKTAEPCAYAGATAARLTAAPASAESPNAGSR